MDFVPDAHRRGEILAAVERWERAARDYGIVKGRVNPRTRMQDAMRHAELSATPMTTARALDGYDAVYTTGDQLSEMAIQLGIDPTPLDLFLSRPDPDEGLTLALLVVKRVRQRLQQPPASGMPAPAPADGPRPGCLLFWGGASVSIEPTPWELLNFLWKQSERSATRAEVLEAVWPGKPEAADGDALKTAIRKANAALLTVNAPFSVSKKGRHITLG